MKFLIISFLFFYSMQVLSAEGGWSGNGGGSLSEADNIWFIGDKEINYCLKISDDYPLDKETITNLIENNISKWKEFYSKYDLLDKKLAQGYNRATLNTVHFHDGLNRGVNFNFQYKDDCKEARLTFLFGLETKLVKAYKYLTENHPYGLAIRQKYDHKNYAHQGVIWIDNFSTDEKEISHVLLHELGHMFGMKHNSVHIMDENLGRLVGETRQFNSQFLGVIESDSWSYRILKEVPLVMTSKRGFFPAQAISDTATPALCGDKNFSPNSTIPAPIRLALGLGTMDCHKLTIINLGKVGHKNSYKFSLEELFSKKTKSFLGFLRGTIGIKPELIGPSVVTDVRRLTPAGLFFKTKRKLTLEKEATYKQLTGVLADKETKYPVKLSFYKGPIIEIFVPKAHMWWTLKTKYNQIN